MKVTREKTENSQAYLTIEVDQAEVDAELGKSYQRLVKKANIPGFRKGKAPRPILERHLGKEALLEDALEYLVPKAYEDAVKEEGLETVAQPSIEITSTAPVTFKATVPLKPTVELGDYLGIRVPEEKTDVSEEDLNHTMEHLQHERSTLEPVEREVRLEDTITFHIESTIDGEPYINQEGAVYRVRDSDAPVPGFPEQLVGMKAGEEKEFKLKFPEDYHDTDRAGKEAVFKIKLNEMKQEVLPELTDDFARQVDPDIADMAALKDRIMTSLRQQAEARAKNAYEDRVLEEAVSRAKLAYPPVLVEHQVEHMIEDMMQRFGADNFQAYLNRTGKSHEALHEELHQEAEKRVQRSLVLGKLRDVENIAVSEADIEAEIQRMTEGRDEQGKHKLVELLNTPEARESIKDSLTIRKAIDRLAEIARTAPETAPAG